MSERVIQANGIEIWTQSFGDPAHATVLLIMGGPGQGIMWPDHLCEALSDGGRHVIRYDNRDTGLSTTFDFSTDPYTISDLAEDAMGVLDAYGVTSAHLVGFSMGGAVAQTAALDHPDRVASLTSWGSSPLAASYVSSFQGDTSGSLPGPAQNVVDAVTLMHEPAAGHEERIDRFIGLVRAFAGTLAPVDEQEVRNLAKCVISRMQNPAALVNPAFAMASSPIRTEDLSRITAPTLVIHGTADPVVPLVHGEVTAEAIPGARLLTVEGLGHDFPRPALPQIVDAILEHSGRVT